MPLNRREFAKQSAATGAGLALTGAVGTLATAPEALAAEDREGHGRRLGYGPLVEDLAGTLTLQVLLGVASGHDGPDNITVSPYGGLAIAEDGEGVQHLFGATERGRTYPIARNELIDSEFTGVVFSPDGATLFACIQSPGIMVAVTGPWRRQPRR